MPLGFKSKAQKTTPVTFEQGSDNVFADLDLPNPEMLLAKAKLVQHIRQAMQSNRLTLSKTAQRLGLTTTAFTSLIDGQTEAYSIDQLVQFLNSLGQRIEFRVHPTNP